MPSSTGTKYGSVVEWAPFEEPPADEVAPYWPVVE